MIDTIDIGSLTKKIRLSKKYYVTNVVRNQNSLHRKLDF